MSIDDIAAGQQVDLLELRPLDPTIDDAESENKRDFALLEGQTRLEYLVVRISPPPPRPFISFRP